MTPPVRALAPCILLLGLLGGGCASLTPEKSRIPSPEADNILTAIRTHREDEALRSLESLQPRLQPPLDPSEEKFLNHALASAADQGAACPQRVVTLLMDTGAALDAKDLKKKITRWLMCPDLLSTAYRLAKPEQKAAFAGTILQTIPNQVEAGSLVLRKAVVMENRSLGDKILEVTREQLEEYGWVFRTVLKDSEDRCARQDREFCMLKDEAVRMRNWFKGESERKRGLVLQGQLDPSAQSGFLEIVDAIYGPLLRAPEDLESKHDPTTPSL